MTTNNLRQSEGLPSAAELEAIANSIFPEYNTSECADGINNLAEKGDTAVVGKAMQKAGMFSERYANKTVQPFEIGGTFGNNYTELDSYARLADEIMSGGGTVGNDAFFPAVSPLDGFFGITESLTSMGTGSFGAVESAAQTADNDLNKPKYSLDENDLQTVVSELDGFGTYRPLENSAEKNQPKAAGYSPVVISQAQKQNETIPSEKKEIPVTDNFKQTNNNAILIGSRTLEQIRSDFPILAEKVNGNNLVWLDNGATTQRPRAVIDRLSYYYTHENSNVHRGAHELAARSTDAYEGARQTVADFIGAPDKSNIVFVRGTTEGINLVAHSFVKQYLKPGDEIILTLLEHHANIVPWQLIAQETGAVIKVAPVDKSGQIIISEYEKLFTGRTKFVSATQVSNVLGTITPVAEMISIAHAHGVRILIDGAQSVAHIPVNVTALDADFFVFSGHKIYAPTGIGAVYGKSDLLEAAKPYQGGGNMIADVTFERTIYNPAPNKFEAGTASIGDAVGLGAALEYLNKIGMPEVSRYEHELINYGMKELGKINGLHLIGTAAEKSSALSFVLDGYDNERVGQLLNNYGIAVRTGHHCAQPVLRSYGLEGVVRPTLALYNSFEDIDILVRAVRTIAR